MGVSGEFSNAFYSESSVMHMYYNPDKEFIVYNLDIGRILPEVQVFLFIFVT